MTGWTANHANERKADRTTEQTRPAFGLHLKLLWRIEYCVLVEGFGPECGTVTCSSTMNSSVVIDQPDVFVRHLRSQNKHPREYCPQRLAISSSPLYIDIDCNMYSACTSSPGYRPRAEEYPAVCYCMLGIPLVLIGTNHTWVGNNWRHVS